MMNIVDSGRGRSSGYVMMAMMATKVAEAS